MLLSGLDVLLDYEPRSKQNTYVARHSRVAVVFQIPHYETSSFRLVTHLHGFSSAVELDDAAA